jgi:outer membrane lipoprotein SlyB
MTSESSDAAKAKKGWSKTAKGAVIGGVVGAGTGAVVNKKNRAIGAVVGGVAGAGAGAIIGNEMDKKDGRH